MTELPNPDAKLFSPSAEQNKDPILAVLQDELNNSGKTLRLLEVGSGTGQHAIHFCGALTQVEWHPSEVSDNSLQSIRAYSAEAGLGNLQEPRLLDLTQWRKAILEEEVFDIVFACNVIHISPWAATEGLFELVSERLEPSGKLITYGPYFERSRPIAASNRDFDLSLKDMNPAFGVRFVENLASLADSFQLQLQNKVDMPRDNLMLVFTRS